MLPIPTVTVLGNEVTAQMPHATSATVVARPREDPTMLAAEQVAGVVAGIPTLGEACDALRKAGRRASIAGNRITVNDEVFAQFIGATVGSPGGVDARVGDLQDRRHTSGMGCWSGASAVIARSQTPGTRQPMKRTDSPIDVVYNAGRLGLRGAISNPLRIDLVSGAWLRIETSSSRGPMPVGRRPATRQSHEQQVQSDTAPGRRTMITWLSGDRGPATFHREPVRRPSVKGLSNLRGPFGVLDSNRIDVKREQFRGHLLDRQMLELIRAG